jgi:hypothetical protein
MVEAMEANNLEHKPCGKPDKVIFLDIDGVLQPWGSQKRFAHLKEMDKVYKELLDRYGVDYSSYDRYDVSAVYFDWDKESVAELKRILEATGAQIVISSDWRVYSPIERLSDFFRIYDLAAYIVDYTPVKLNFELLKEQNAAYKNMWHRSIEILEYLKAHPEIKSWVTIDDLHLDGDLGENAVVTSYKMEKKDADKCIEVLNSTKR